MASDDREPDETPPPAAAAESDSDESPTTEPAAKAPQRRKARRHLRSFLPMVTHPARPAPAHFLAAIERKQAERAEAEAAWHREQEAMRVRLAPYRRGEPRHVKGLDDLMLVAPEPQNPIQVRVGRMAQRQALSTGAVRAMVATMPLHDLKAAVGYMLTNGMLAEPERYDRLAELREDQGGRDILLNEVMKEPPEVLDDLFQLGGRLKSRRVLSATRMQAPRPGGARGARGGDDDGDAGDRGFLTERRALDYAQNLPYERLPRRPQDNTLRQRWYYNQVPEDPFKMLLGNLGPPFDDPAVYLRHPVRMVKGHVDAPPKNVVELCGPETDRFLRRSALETRRLPEMHRFADQRDKVAEYRRAMCRLDGATAAPFLRALQSAPEEEGGDYADPMPLEDADLRMLEQIGWTPALIESVYGDAARRSREKILTELDAEEERRQQRTATAQEQFWDYLDAVKAAQEGDPRKETSAAGAEPPSGEGTPAESEERDDVGAAAAAGAFDPQSQAPAQHPSYTGVEFDPERDD